MADFGDGRGDEDGLGYFGGDILKEVECIRRMEKCLEVVGRKRKEGKRKRKGKKEEK